MKLHWIPPKHDGPLLLARDCFLAVGFMVACCKVFGPFPKDAFGRLPANQAGMLAWGAISLVAILIVVLLADSNLFRKSGPLLVGLFGVY